MDALLIFDPQNSLISIKYNKQFYDYLIQFMNENGFKIENHFDIEDINQSETLKNFLSVLLTPFVASQRYLTDNNEIKFDCISNSNAVFSKRQQFFFLYIFGDNEREILMQKKVEIFAQIIQLIFGPSMQSIKTNHYLVEIAFNMIEKWQQLSENMTFMLESIERLMVGPDLSSLCNQTLQHILTNIRLKSSIKEIPCHTYLFYGLKYITSYSTHNTTKISRGDMLLMLLLNHSIDNTIKIEVNNESKNTIYNEEQDSVESNLSNTHKVNSFVNYKESNYHQLLVFLQSYNNPNLLVPYIYRRFTIEDDLFVIILSELPSQLPLNLSNIINIIDTLVNEPNEKRCFHTVIQLQTCIKKIKDYAFKNNLLNDKIFFVTLNNLNKLMNTKICDHIIDSNKKCLSFQLEAQLSAINNSLRECYKLLIFDDYYINSLNPSIQTSFINFFHQTQCYCKKTFSHYLGYFKVKSQRNMTLLGIQVDIKDLIGFIYIDRTINELIIAPIEEYIHSDCHNKEDIPLKDNSFTQMYSSQLTDAIVNMVLHAYDSLTNGNLMSVWTDGLLHYSYSMWFEDSSGSTLKPRVNNFKLDTYPSIICGNFIQHIINKSFGKYKRKCEASLSHKENKSCYPYELFCIYKTISTYDEINLIENTKKLASKLWEITISSEI